MTWTKLDDQFLGNLKVVRAGPAAAWLYVCSLVYSNQQSTDGRIPKEVLPSFPNMGKVLASAEKLVAVGLFEREGQDFIIHDFHDWNPSKQEVEQKRSKRQANGRLGGKQTASKRQAKEAVNRNPAPTPVTDVVTNSNNFTVVVDKSVENSAKREALVARLVSAVGLSGFAIVKEADTVIDLLSGYFALHVIDEMIGTSIGLKNAPKHPRYLLGMAPGWAEERGITGVPDLLEIFKSRASA